MYISAVGGFPPVSINTAVCNDNPIVEITNLRILRVTHHPQTLPSLYLFPAK